MKKLLAFGTLLCTGLGTNPQISLQSTITTGFAFPLPTDKINSAHNGNAMHYGSHIDLLAGQSNFRIGIGGFAGQIIGLNSGDYKTTAQELASKYRLASDKFIFAESSFRSSAFLIGPIADWQLKQMSLSFWAKGGYSLNEPGKFSATIQDAGAVSRVFMNQAGSNKNSFACNLGSGLRYRINEMISLQLAANYFDTKTELVNFNYDREKGTAPLNFTAHNSFIQAVFGLHFGLSGRKATKTYENKSYADIVSRKSNQKSDVYSYGVNSNERRINNSNEDEFITDTIIFDPQTIQLKAASQSYSGRELQSSNNYLTAFLYRTENGLEVSQCSGQKSPGDPIPGLDVKLKNRNSAQVYNVRTNEDGSFSVKNMEDGVYEATANNESAYFSLNNKTGSEDYRIADFESGECGIMSNNIINVEGQMYAEVITAREAGSGMASGKVKAPRDVATGQSSGKRMHKPFTVINTDYDLNYNNIIRVDGLLYAEVISAREAGSGMASGKRTFIHGDLDGDGRADRITASQNTQSLRGSYSPPQIGDEVMVIERDSDEDGVIEYYVVSPRDAASGMASGKRQHGSVTIVKEWGTKGSNQRKDLASGQSSGKRQHGTVTIVKGMNSNEDIFIVEENDNYDALEYNVKSPRDVATGQSSGRMSRQDLDKISTETGNVYLVSPRDAASGLPTGKRQHGEVIIIRDNNAFEYEVKAPRDVATGQSSGKRQHGEVIIIRDNIAFEYEVKAPRDVATGQSSGKRQHGEVVITKNHNAFEYEVKAPRDVATGQSSGKRTHKPLRWNNDPYSEDAMRMMYTVEGSKGNDMAFEIPLIMDGDNTGEWNMNTSYAVRKITKSRSNIQNNRTGNNSSNTADQKSLVNTSRSNIKNKLNSGSSGLPDTNKASINTTRSNIKGMAGNIEVIKINRVNCSNGNCTMDATVSIDGMEYDAVISGKLKTSHDMTMSIIGNLK